MATEISLLSDDALYFQCQQYGALTLYYRRKFIGLLPEVNRRRLFEKKGFSSIFEFGFKLAGLSEEQIKLTLRLKERFEDRPLLQGLLQRGEVSVNKLARIAGVATPENEEFWARQVQNLSKKTLETLIRDERDSEEKNDRSVPTIGSYQTNPENVLSFDSMPGHNLKLCDEVLKKLSELQRKGINLDELLLEFLKKREQEIEKEKHELADIATKKAVAAVASAGNSRYIPARTKKLLKKEYGEKCAIPHCKRKAEEIHHTSRYSLTKNHNPYYLAPLCKQHHQIAHCVDQKVLKHRKARGAPPGRPSPSELSKLLGSQIG